MAMTSYGNDKTLKIGRNPPLYLENSKRGNFFIRNSLVYGNMNICSYIGIGISMIIL